MMTKELVKAGLGVILAALVGMCNEGCQPAHEARQEICTDQGYKRALAACVIASETQEQADDCQAVVRMGCGVSLQR
jgi:hypothetical protein